MYAIIEDGGRQLKVTTGDTILIDRQVGEDEKSVTFDRVLLVGGEGVDEGGSGDAAEHGVLRLVYVVVELKGDSEVFLGGECGAGGGDGDYELIGACAGGNAGQRGGAVAPIDGRVGLNVRPEVGGG